MGALKVLYHEGWEAIIVEEGEVLNGREFFKSDPLAGFDPRVRAHSRQLREVRRHAPGGVPSGERLL